MKSSTEMPDSQFRVGETLANPLARFRLARAFPFLVAFGPYRKWLLGGLPNVSGCKISPGFYAVVGSNLVAERANLNDTTFIDYAPITIGENTAFSGQNLVLTSTHDLQDFSVVHAAPVRIGRNVWITYRCIILGGVTIGDNAVIGAGSVVSSDIPANVVAAGNPCRVIRAIERGDIESRPA
jgi:maltose O-acetyltransferase